MGRADTEDQVFVEQEAHISTTEDPRLKRGERVRFVETVVLNLFIWVAILIFGYYLDGEFLLVSYNSEPGKYLGGFPFLVLSAALVINAIILSAGALSGVLDKHLPTLRNLAWGMTVTVTIAGVLYMKFVR